MDLIDRSELLEFPHSPEAGTDDMIRDIAFETLPNDIEIEDQDILDFGWAIIEAMLNVIRTAESVKV